MLRPTGSDAQHREACSDLRWCLDLFEMGRPGLEPGTSRLKAEYSTIELATLKGCMPYRHRNLH